MIMPIRIISMGDAHRSEMVPFQGVTTQTKIGENLLWVIPLPLSKTKKRTQRARLILFRKQLHREPAERLLSTIYYLLTTIY